MRMTLAFLQKLTLDPWNVTPADIAPLKEQGLSEEAIEEAIRVCLCFNTMDRLADALDFQVSAGRQLRLVKFMLTRIGYGAASVPG